MSFQFPANPSDGDIVVRGNLKATYTLATDTGKYRKSLPPLVSLVLLVLRVVLETKATLVLV